MKIIYIYKKKGLSTKHNKKNKTQTWPTHFIFLKNVGNTQTLLFFLQQNQDPPPPLKFRHHFEKKNHKNKNKQKQ